MTPEQEKAARRALAALTTGSADADRRDRTSSPRPTDPPVPPDVAARLDEVLADLTAPRRAQRDDLAARRAAQERSRRRQHRQHLLVVAAAVAVIALGGGAVALRGLQPGGTAASSSRSSTDPGAASAPAAGSTSEGPRLGSGPRSALPSNAAGAAPGLRRATLRADVDRLLASRSTAEAATGDLLGCVQPSAAPGERLLGVRLDGRRAVLAVSADGRRARVFSCTTADRVLAATTLAG